MGLLSVADRIWFGLKGDSPVEAMELGRRLCFTVLPALVVDHGE